MYVKIIDTTLREGRQSLFFDKIHKIQDKYLQTLFKMGIKDIEYRNPSISSKEIKKYEKTKNKFPKLNFYIHLFLNKKNIDWSIKDKSVEYISTFLTSPITSSSLELLKYLVTNSNKHIRVAIENSSTISEEELNKVLLILNKYPSITRIGFSDTMGVFTPDSIIKFISLIKSGLGRKDIEFHLHNDFGLAASTAVQILSEFKETNINLYFSTSMYGLGERNGILSYGDLFSNMLRLKIPHNFNLEFYGELLSIMDKQKIFFNRDPINTNNFYHFASSHIISNIHGNKYENLDPHSFGLKSNLVFNQLTTDDVYNQVASELLKRTVPLNRSAIKIYVLKEAKKQNKKYLLLNEVTKILLRFYEKS